MLTSCSSQHPQCYSKILDSERSFLLNLLNSLYQWKCNNYANNNKNEAWGERKKIGCFVFASSQLLLTGWAQLPAAVLGNEPALTLYGYTPESSRN